MIITRDPTILREFDAIVRTDFKRFVNHRKCLNRSNLYLVYIFHLIQSLGIFTTTISVSLFASQYTWIGIFLNTVASLIYIYEQVNTKISHRLQADLIAILQNRYICETPLIEP